ncbi:MAG: hypothetical protein Q7R35_15695 [Elusimicrobiota bacterium]|nr:hypothetical protein [Elusimicrobiota bacterium]
MPNLEVEDTIKMLIALLAGKDVEVTTPAEIETKAALLKDIAYAKEKGYQIEIPYGDGT